MLAGNISLIPTLKLFKWELERIGISSVDNPLINTAIQQLGEYSKAGGQILFGTDVGYMTDYSPTDEYELMARAGMSFEQILASLTTAPAKRFGFYKISGRIALGMNADIVLLGGDPITDIKSFSNVAYTIYNGRIIYRSKN